MGESNGSLKVGNGHANGHAKGKSAGQLVPRRQIAVKKRRGFLSWAFHTIARLATWAAILTIVFRCPSTLKQCDEASPAICKYYYQTKNAVSPHVKPYYDRFAEPYMNVALPYYEAVNSKVISPTRTYAVYCGAPYVEKAQTFGRTHWERNGQPHLLHMQNLVQTKFDEIVAPHIAKASEALVPYYEIGRTNGLQLYHDYVIPAYDLVNPHVAKGYNVASAFTVSTVLPSINWAWGRSSAFVDTTILPQIRVLYVENVEPQLVRIGERLGRYKTKMASSSPVHTPQGDNSAYSSFSRPTSQQTSTTLYVSDATTPSETVIPASNDPEDFIKPVEAPLPAENESDKRKEVREMVAEDLEMWQAKFAAQADEGASDMEDRVAEIAKRMIDGNAQTTGQKLVTELEKVVEMEIGSLKDKISAAIGGIRDDSDKADAESMAAIRSAGMAIKDAASAVRQWRQDYGDQLEREVTQAADIHFQILDETRALALQQIGMKWAWADGVTYKDWAKYHELKSTLSQWTQQLKELIVTDPKLVEAQEVSAQFEDESMDIASAAAKELARLKEVALWKITAKDATGNFESDAMRIAAEAAEHARKEATKKAAQADETIVQPVKEAIISAAGSAVTAGSGVISYAKDGTSSAASIVSAATEAIASEASKAPEVVRGQSSAAEQIVSSVLAKGEETATSAAEDLSSVISESASIFSEQAEDTLWEASDSASTAFDDTYSAVSETASSATKIADEESTSAAESLATQASEAVIGRVEDIVANVTEDGPSNNQEPVQDAPVVEEDPSTQKDDTPNFETVSVKPAFLGAMAQEVPERHIVLEDYVDTDIVSNAVGSAEAAYSNAVAAASEQYSSAVSVVSAQIYGTPKPVHEQLIASVSGAYENAVAAASSRYNEALSGLKGTPTVAPTPTTLLDWNKVERIAAERLNEGRLWADVQYQSALIALGMATATPTATSDKIFQEAKKNYYAGLGLAQERYANFVSAASSAMHSLTASPTPTDIAGSASSMASVAKESAASVVNAAEEAANAAYSAATETVASAVSAVNDGIQEAIDGASEQMYVAGVALADTWDSVVSELNLQIYGAEPSQIGWYDNLIKDASSAAAAATGAATDKAAWLGDAAGDSASTASAEAARQYDAVSQLVSELIYGKEPTFSESVVSRLNAAYATAAANIGNFANDASAAAAAAADKVGSAASEATAAVKETVLNGKDEL